MSFQDKLHPGVTRMKAVARSFMWWPGLNKQIEDTAKSCTACQAVKASAAVCAASTLGLAIQTLDFAGPFQGSMFLIAVDAYGRKSERCHPRLFLSPSTYCENGSVSMGYSSKSSRIMDHSSRPTGSRSSWNETECATSRVHPTTQHRTG